MPSDTTSLFQLIHCPLCNAPEFDVVKEARYPPAITLEDMKQSFHASSDHELLDQVVRCRGCTLVYVNPRLDAQVLTGGYSDAEDPLFVAQNDARISTFRQTLENILKRLKLSGSGKRLLDVGCAGAAFPVAARNLGFDVVGIEPSRWLADFGRRTYGIDIRQGVLEEETFPKQSFDVVTLWDVIEHLPYPTETLQLIRSLLKPGGMLFVNYPDISSVVARLMGKRWPFWLSVHLLYYTRETMRAQLTRTGFEPLWFQSGWPSLPVGYVARRAVPYFRPAAILPPVLDFLRLSRIPITYNMGQTMVVARLQ
jgi:2-polyprenyl-3-methyl-5-hydroxy-6-metoxy-1,4-benzoquinol methylase